jgi:dimethylhistidine N-methyltransferase
MSIETKTEENAFKIEISKGLFKKPKSISSKFFYNDKGDALFQEIMNLDEYYLTDCELEIFKTQKNAILEAITKDEDQEKETFNLIEFGAGDGTKTKILIDHFLSQNIDFIYHPVDISAHVLEELELDLSSEFPDLEIHPINKEYFEAIDYLSSLNDRKNIILFLGSNIGNFDKWSIDNFFSSLSNSCAKGDQLLIGVDLKKDPAVILNAYSDSEGITEEFNLNLLARANQELGANFKLENFKHYASYNPENGEARSYLISLVDQEVFIKNLNKTVTFLRSEFIHTEISKKYNLSELEHLASLHDMRVDQHFTDSKTYFVDTLWTIN